MYASDIFFAWVDLSKDVRINLTKQVQKRNKSHIPSSQREVVRDFFLKTKRSSNLILRLPFALICTNQCMHMCSTNFQNNVQTTREILSTSIYTIYL